MNRINLVTHKFALFVATLFVATTSFAADPLDWPYWRGPEGNSISRETGLPDTINPAGGDGSNLVWKKEHGKGRGTPVVMNGKLYTLTRDREGTKEEGEKVVAINIETGSIEWENRFNVWSSDVPDTRVGWSSVVGDPATGNVFALGVCGQFQCINGETGKTLWSVPMHEQFGMLSTYGGRTNMPIVFEDLVIVGSVVIGWGEMARPSHRLIAFDKKTGEVEWYSSTRPLPEDTIYPGPVLAVIDGQQLLITPSGDGWVYAFQPRTGKKVWEYQFSRRGINSSPVVDGDTVYIGHSEENPEGTKMGAVAAIKGGLKGDITKTGEIWKQLEIGVGRSGLLVADGKLYCGDDAGKLFVLDAKTGGQIGKKIGLGTMNFATPLFADGKIYHVEKNGRWYILTPNDKDGVGKFARGKTTGNFPSGDECWSSPVVSHGKLFIQTTGALYCFEDKTKEHGSTPRPEMAKEADIASDEKPALLQVVPAELILKPGTTQKFSVRAFNSRGQLLQETPEVEFAVDANGEISKDGEFKAADDAAHVAAYITAKSGELTGKARVRIVPPLPWKFEFTGLKDAPITWVGARYRHVMRKVDGNDVMVKITTIPKGTRSRAWFGPTDLHDYTIQADMFPTTKDNKLPDMGVIAQGYKFAVEPSQGGKKLVLNSWDSHDYRTRVDQPVSEFPDLKFEPNQWYTLKLKVSNVEAGALVQGKIWKRSEKEPSEWTVEMTDKLPNKTGAPGMHCNATDAEIYIDNVIVTPNEQQ